MLNPNHRIEKNSGKSVNKKPIIYNELSLSISLKNPDLG